MKDVYWLEPTVRFEDNLVYAKGMKIHSTPCDVEPEHTKRTKWPRPLRVVGPVRALTDFEWSVYGDVLVGETVAAAFKRAGFSGIQLVPAEIFTTTGTQFGRELFELRVVGWGGMASRAAGIRVIEDCPGCDWKKYSGFVSPEALFDSREWDGSDFFIIWPMPREFFVTPRVREFILHSGFSGVRVRHIRELPRPVAGTLTPGVPADWFLEGKKAIANQQISESAIAVPSAGPAAAGEARR